MPFRRSSLAGRISGRLAAALRMAFGRAGLRELRSGARYKRLAELAYVTMWVAEADGSWLERADNWEGFTGQREDEARGWGWLEMIAPDDREAFRAAWLESVRSGAPFARETSLWRSERRAHAPALAKAVAIRGADGRVEEWAGGFSDLSEAKRQEEMLARYAQRLSVKNKALEEFAYAASHDLQEPLRKIRAYGDLLKEDCAELGEEAASHVRVMQSAAARMSRLIEDLMAYSRASVERMELEKIDLAEAAREVLADCEIAIAESGAEVEIGELPVVESDRSLTRVALHNLVTNALKYRREGVAPRVSIRARLRTRAELGAFGARLPAERNWEIEVADNGIGFDPKHAESIFKPFLRLHGAREYSGTGIGLAMCAQAVERLGGGIRAEGEPGKGARFYVYFRAT